MRNSRSRVPGDNPESRAGPGVSRKPARAPTPSRIGPGPAEDPPRGAPRGLAARAHTRTTHTHTSPGRPRRAAAGRRCARAQPSPLALPSAPIPDPGLGSRGTEDASLT